MTDTSATLETWAGGARRRGGIPSPGPIRTDVVEYLAEISSGAVVGIRPSGPVFGKRVRRRRPRGILVPTMPVGARVAVALLTVGWILTLVFFIGWWLLPSHRLDWPGFLINSGLIALVLALSAYFLRYISRLHSVPDSVDLPSARVAMVVTKAPSEPWDMVRGTLEAMLDQECPGEYHVWLADEDPSEETIQWCTENGVYISTRRGIEEYQQTTWPRRRRCKEGNLAYFYDQYGYRHYDIVCQLDSDHVPSRTYLTSMVRPFADPAVGYVAAPSVCDANIDVSWTVRGRPYEEARFHGAQQLGLNIDGGPVCIGSHYAVRTEALRSIGGIGPELAEDFSTSYLLNVAGWRGTFAIDAEAHGDGPVDFGAMVTQEFQWARSLTNVFFGLVLRTVNRVPFGMAFRYLFQSGFSLLMTLMTLGGMALLAVASATHTPWARVNVIFFFGLWILLNAWMLAVNAVLRRQRMLRPITAPLVSWEQALYVASRWPYTVMGALSSVYERIVPRAIDFKVTPKGENGPQRFAVRLVVPYCVTALVMTVCAWLGFGSPDVIGYVGLGLLTALSQLACALTVVVMHAVDAHRNTGISRSQAFDLISRPLLLWVPTAFIVIEVAATYLVDLVVIVKELL